MYCKTNLFQVLQKTWKEDLMADFQSQIIMRIICTFMSCFHVYISRTHFCTNHLQPVALHVRKWIFMAFSGAQGLREAQWKDC